MKRFFVFAIPAIAVLFISSERVTTFGQQDTNSDPDIKVTRPAYLKKHPKVLFDEAHFNVHTSGGRSKAFADLIANDGYRVIPNIEKFEWDRLNGVDILLIVSALGANREMNPEAAGNPAFTEEECEVVKNWILRGGGLLLITDHEPTGAAARNLAKRFGVEMSKLKRLAAEVLYRMPPNNRMHPDRPIMALKILPEFRSDAVRRWRVMPGVSVDL